MARPRTYTDEQRSAVYVALQLHDGNVARASRETGVPQGTIRTWRKGWEQEGVPEAVETEAAVQADQFVEDATRVRNAALTQLESKIPDAKVGELTTVVGVLDDKIARARMIARHETPQGPRQIDAAAAGELLAGFVKEALRQSEERRAAISEATENKPIGALPAQT